MAHEINLITTIAAALGLALVMGFVASRFKIPPVVGYLIAGIIIGPATPGFVADIGISWSGWAPRTDPQVPEVSRAPRNSNPF